MLTLVEVIGTSTHMLSFASAHSFSLYWGYNGTSRIWLLLLLLWCTVIE